MSEIICNQTETGIPPGTQLSENKRRLLHKFLSGHPARNSTETPAIGRRPAGEPIPLSFPQQQIWLHAQMAADIPFYNETMTIYREGPLDIAVLERCFLEIVRRHEIWRTTFESRGGEPLQIVHSPPDAFPLQMVDLRSLPEKEREFAARRLATVDAQRPFDLQRGPLFRVLPVRTEDERYRLYMTLHHLIFDGATASRVLLPELAALYEAFSVGKPSPLPELPIQYGDFAYAQRKRSELDVSCKLEYWRKQLAGELPQLQWPNDRPRPPIETHRGAIERYALPASLVRMLRSLSREQGVSLYMTLLSALVTLLHRYTGQHDIVVGSLTAGRKLAELEPLLGYFVNPLALRIDLSGNPSFRELQSRVRGVVLDALAHDDVPFAQIVNEVQHKPDPSRNPLFQIVLYQQPQLPNVIPGWDLRTEEISNGGSKVDLAISTDDRGEVVFGPITYNPDLFDPPTITRMVSHWQTLLAAVCVDAERRISELPILTEAERKQILVEWNVTTADYPKNSCLHELIAAQAERTPDATAVVYEKSRLSYRELNRRANQFANYLRQRGVGRGVLVGICVERSPEMLVALLGILKAGAAYVPLDPTYPQERLSFMLRDSAVRVLVTMDRLKERLPALDAQLVFLDCDWASIAQHSADDPRSEATPDDLAYLIYTSGSTGKPKGAMIVHRGLVNYLCWAARTYDVEAGRSVPVHSSISFDLTVTGLYPPLLVGGIVELLPENPGIDALAAAIRQGETRSLIKITPAHLELLSQQLKPEEAAGRAKALIIGGENLRGETMRFWKAFAPETRLINEYGPTETVVGCCVYEATEDDCNSASVPIGRPIANTQLYILDPYLNPVPIGAVGELYIGGAGVARGYLNRPELTAQRFIPDPFSTQPGARLYKTGDLARYRPDGNIEFLGRDDDQVKIRGFRIELGEIEAVLREHPRVREARVIVREDAPGDRRLVAYIVPREQAASTLAPIRDYLKDKLPSYMIPMLVTLDRLPITPNGKLDHRALPVPVRPETQNFTGARNAIEQTVVEIWTEVLGVEAVSVYDNFFDLGGHSLLAMQAVACMEKRLGLRIRPKELAFQTLGQLAASCKERLHSAVS